MRIILTDISTSDTLTVSGRIDGVDNFTLTIRRKEDRKIVKSFSNELTFYDDGYDFLQTRLIENEDGFLKSIKVDIYDDCCTDDNSTGYLKVFEGEIRGDAIDWCEGDCKITCNIIEKNSETSAYDLLDSVLVIEPQEATAFEARYNIPRMYYCNEIRPAWLHYFLFVAKIMLGIMLVILTPLLAALVAILAIVYVICLIIAVFSRLTRDDCQKFNPGEPIKHYRELWNELKLISGCGRYHPSPFVRDYIDWMCRKAGISWESSIFNPASEYYNTVYFYAPSEKGRDDDKDELIVDNIPLKTGLDFLDELAIVFNADFWIIDNKLIFERKDKFYSAANVWIDVTNLGDRLIEDICYEWRNDNRWAGAIVNYTQDALDVIGNEAMRQHLYKEIIDWNTPPKTGQKGLKKTNIPFGAVRVRNDGIEEDISTKLGEALEYKDAVLIDKDHTSIPKLMVWTNTYRNGRVKKVNGYYNYPYYVDDRDSTGTIYNYHKIDNPRMNYISKFDFTLRFVYNCNELKDFLQNNGFLKYVNLVKGGERAYGVPEELEVNFKEKSIRVTGRL